MFDGEYLPIGLHDVACVAIDQDSPDGLNSICMFNITVQGNVFWMHSILYMDSNYSSVVTSMLQNFSFYYE